MEKIVSLEDPIEIVIYIPRGTEAKAKAAATEAGQSVEAWILDQIVGAMEDPSPRQDLAGAIASLQRTVKETKKILSEIHKEETLTISEIAARRGVSRSSIYEHPWRLPNFGVPDFAARPRRWKLSTVLAWEAVDEDTHKAEWETMDGRTKARIRKRSAA
jgi:predicted DNA-binding transcriptional regulator AlpA